MTEADRLERQKKVVDAVLSLQGDCVGHFDKFCIPLIKSYQAGVFRGKFDEVTDNPYFRMPAGKTAFRGKFQGRSSPYKEDY